MMLQSQGKCNPEVFAIFSQRDTIIPSERKVMEMAKYVPVKVAAEVTGFTQQYLRDLYHYPGQQFCIKKDPRKDRSHILYDLDAFYEFLKRREIKRRRR